MIEFSILIPFQTVSPYLYETLDAISYISGPGFEVILLPDDRLATEGFERYNYPLRVFPTGQVSPAIKRDKGAEKSVGKYLAFIDDDAFPAPDWLNKTLPHFSNKEIAAVGGPQITPDHDTFWQKVSGAVFLSPLNGKAVHRYWPGKKTLFIDDWPSVNLIVRKDDFLSVGGFDNTYWPGEDTKLCFDLTRNKKKIIYEPGAKVYHHRRAGFFKHIKQVGNYGLHRGYFAKRFPATSMKISYMLPSCFFLFTSLGWISLLLTPLLAGFYLSLWVIYFFIVWISTLLIINKIKDPRIAFATIPYLVATHFWYGWRFLKGFVFVKKLKSKLGR